jgi:hypothetical protein
MHSAIYLALDALYDEIQARIIQEIMHGLFHAFLEFTEYERITGGSGVLAGVDVCSVRVEHRGRSSLLSARTRKTHICLVKDGGILSNSPPSQKTRDFLLKGLSKRTAPLNIFALLFAAHSLAACHLEIECGHRSMRGRIPHVRWC